MPVLMFYKGEQRSQDTKYKYKYKYKYKCYTIEWLLDCGLIKKVYNVSKPAMPLKAYMEFSAFKLFLLDVGLLGAMSEVDAKTILEGNSIFIEFKGALTEQYVLQQLIADTAYTPYYFSEAKSEGEDDKYAVMVGVKILSV